MTNDEIIRNATRVLESTIVNELGKLNTGLPPAVIREIIDTVLKEQTSNLVTGVFSEANSKLNSIPSSLVGSYNPVDIVTKNLGSAGIFKNLNPSIDATISPRILQDLVSQLKSKVYAALPPNSPAIIILEQQFEVLNKTVSDSVSQAVGGALESFTGSIFSNIPKVPSLLSGIAGLFGASSGAPAFSLELVKQALEKTDLNFSNSLASDTLNKVKNFSIENTDNNEKLVATQKGFMDPSATYPTKEYANQPETNKLARGEVAGTIVQKKNSNRVVGAKLPYDDSFDEPLSPFNGTYPYNKVTQTESGHVIEVDDTPGNERLHVYHKSGTYIEIDSNGTVVKRTKGSSYEIIDCNGKIAILGKADISVNGECNIFVGNDVNLEVMGDVNLTCYNDITAQAGGTLNLSAKEEINIHSEVVNIEADKALNILSDGNVKILSGVETHLKANTDTFVTADGEIHISANTNFYVTALESTNIIGSEGVLLYSEQDVDVKADGSLNLESDGDTNILGTGGVLLYSEGDVDVKGDGDVNIESGGDTSVNASGNFNADGSEVHLNSGFAGSASTAGTATIAEFAKDAALATVSNVGLLEGRKYADEVDIEDPEPIRFDAKFSEAGEGAVLDKNQIKNQKDSLVLSGIATKDELEDPNPVVIEEKSPTSMQKNILMPDEKLLQVTSLPGNYQLSPNYTLDNMWRTVAVSPGKHVIRAQVGLTYGQIVYNLQALALNILEPVKALYPKMIVTSAFRHEQDNAKSAHPAGLACDLQFPGASRDDYYNIAVKLAQVLSYDQVLLEYWVQANNPWIHIGLAPRGQFNPQSQRKVAWTFKDHALYKQSLVNLA